MDVDKLGEGCVGEFHRVQHGHRLTAYVIYHSALASCENFMVHEGDSQQSKNKCNA